LKLHQVYLKTNDLITTHWHTQISLFYVVSATFMAVKSHQVEIKICYLADNKYNTMAGDQ
jgi:hypothetical protein